MTTPVNHIAIVNQSPLVKDDDVALWVEAYRSEIVKVADAWGLPPPGLAFYPSSHEQDIREECAIFIVKSGGNPDAYGAHTRTGIAIWGYIDSEMCIGYGEPIDRVLGHEIYEMFVDPDLDRWVGPMPDQSHYALELCDPCQRNSYRVTANLFGRTGDVAIADFVLPAWFQPGSAGPYNHLGTIKAPLTDDPGGYHVVERNGVVVSRGNSVKVSSVGRTFRRMAGGWSPRGAVPSAEIA